MILHSLQFIAHAVQSCLTTHIKCLPDNRRHSIFSQCPYPPLFLALTRSFTGTLYAIWLCVQRSIVFFHLLLLTCALVTILNINFLCSLFNARYQSKLFTLNACLTLSSSAFSWSSFSTYYGILMLN